MSLRCPEELLKEKKSGIIVNKVGGFFSACVRVMTKMVVKVRKTWGKGWKQNGGGFGRKTTEELLLD